MKTSKYIRLKPNTERFVFFKEPKRYVAHITLPDGTNRRAERARAAVLTKHGAKILDMGKYVFVKIIEHMTNGDFIGPPTFDISADPARGIENYYDIKPVGWTRHPIYATGPCDCEG